MSPGLKAASVQPTDTPSTAPAGTQSIRRESRADPSSINVASLEAAAVSKTLHGHGRTSVEINVERLADSIKDFLVKKEGSSLRAWLRHFDHNHDQKISSNEFFRGMRRLSYPGDIPHAFTALDHDHSGELSLDEIDAIQASLWRRFRQFCVDSFDGPADMLERLSRHSSARDLDLPHFCSGLSGVGWENGSEELLYNSLDTDDTGYLMVHHLKWLELDKRKQKRKELAKKRAKELKDLKRGGVHDRKTVEQAFKEFQTFLQRKFGNFVRAWRRVLSSDGSLNLHKADLFKACREIGWPGDVRVLWAAFDKDNSGEASIEELDPKGAEMLAHFKRFMVDKFGNAASAFRALDRFNMKKLRRAEFLSAVKFYGFTYSAKSLFAGLDLNCTKSIVEEDLYFLDRWRPPAFLTEQPDRQSAEELKALLLKTYKNFLKAWRHCLDLDGSNRCNWGEFVQSCKQVGFQGNVPGAWRALDDDLSGYISLAEIDPAASATLSNFKAWADEEFGGVRAAFTVFDTDGSNEVTYREFKRTCRAYDFNCHDVRSVFQALDVESNGNLSVEEVMFLDDWEFAVCDTVEEKVEVEETTLEQASQLAHDSNCTRYETIGPGPASYVLHSTIGAGPTTPMLRFRGAYSFRKKPQHSQQLPGIPKDITPSPANYDVGSVPFAVTVARSKPAWAFGSAKRMVTTATTDITPGPGQYAAHLFLDGRQPHHGPAAICSPRRPLKVHPLFNGNSRRPMTVDTFAIAPWSAR